MLTLAMTVSLAAAPADITGVWAMEPPARGPAEARQVVVIGRDEKGVTRAMLVNQRLVIELVKKDAAWEPTPEAAKAATELGVPTLPKIYPLDGKKLGVGSAKPLFSRVAGLDEAVRALEAKAAFTSAQRKDSKAEARGGFFFSATLMERDKPRCVSGVLVPPLAGMEKVLDPVRPTKKGAKLKPLQFAWVGLGGTACEGAVPPAARTEDMNGGVTLLVDAKGVPQAAQLVGYMYAEAFLREGLDAALKKEILEGAGEELQRAAE